MAMTKTIQMGNKQFEVDMTAVESLKKTLDITESEAIETWLFDNGYLEDDSVDEMTEKVKKNGTNKKQAGEKTNRKTRTAKVSGEKSEIFAGLLEYLSKYGDITTKTTTEISFSVNNKDFTVKLTEHRKKK